MYLTIFCLHSPNRPKRWLLWLPLWNARKSVPRRFLHGGVESNNIFFWRGGQGRSLQGGMGKGSYSAGTNVGPCEISSSCLSMWKTYFLSNTCLSIHSIEHNFFKIEMWKSNISWKSSVTKTVTKYSESVQSHKILWQHQLAHQLIELFQIQLIVGWCYYLFKKWGVLFLKYNLLQYF